LSENSSTSANNVSVRTGWAELCRCLQHSTITRSNAAKPGKRYS